MTSKEKQSMTPAQILRILHDAKALDINHIDLIGQTHIVDHMIIASGRSRRHVQGLAQHIIDDVKKNNYFHLSVEGFDNGQWVLLDLGDVVIHVFTTQTREIYHLDKLWSIHGTHEELS